MPRDPVAPVVAAVEALSAAQAGVGTAQDEARRLVAAARVREREARARLHAALVAAARAGVRQVDLVAASGMTREAIRRIVRAGGA